MAEPEVQILLSTFNGQRYLPDLLASLQNQNYKRWSLLARDDGSTDATRRILREFSKVRESIVLQGPNIGPTLSFLTLIQHSAADTDFVALCDQDDVWKPFKISRAIAKLAPIPDSVPAMYCSRLELVHCDLTLAGLSPLPQRKPGFANALVENMATGSTIVLNKAARGLFLEKLPVSAIMHDWWIYLAVSSFGPVVYDPCPGISYRLHDFNVVGQHKGAALFIRRIRKLISEKSRSPIVDQAEDFQHLYGPLLPEEKKRLLHVFLHSRRSVCARLRACHRASFYRQKPWDTLAARCLYVLNRL